MDADKVKINLYFARSDLAALKKLAEKMDIPYSQLIRQACREYIVANAARIAQDARTLAVFGKDSV